MARVVTFGEIMLRLSPPGNLRFVQARNFDAIYGGGESNVAVSLANFGVDAAYVTRLPANEIGDACQNFLRQFGVDTSQIVRGGSRLGIYYLEHGAVSRGSKVIYDRAGSSLAEIQPGMIDWEAVFQGADWFHWTGITPAISAGAADVCLEAVRYARKAGLTVSTDMNYRAKLWKYGKQPREVMEELLENCDVAIGNEEDAEKVFGIHPPDTDVTSGELDAGKYDLALRYAQQAQEAGMESYPLRRAEAAMMLGRILEAQRREHPEYDGYASEEAFRQAISELEKTDRIAAKMKALDLLGRHLLKHGKTDEGERVLDRARRLAHCVPMENALTPESDEYARGC